MTPVPKKRGRPKGSKNKTTVERKAKEEKLVANKIVGVASVSRDMNKYELLCVARDALREEGVHNTWKKMMYDLYSSGEEFETHLEVLKRYVVVKMV